VVEAWGQFRNPEKEESRKPLLEDNGGDTTD
jgi:hypothetical protein